MTGESLRQTDTNFESEENTMKKILALLLAVAMIAAFCACAQQSADTAPAASTDTAAETTTDTAAETPAASDGALIKVGIINNDPNESGYRTANDKDLKAMFTEENGYDASFAYSLKNDEQIAAAQKFIQDEVDYLLISAAGTSGWDSVLQDAQAAGIQVILFDRTIDADESLYVASIVSDMAKARPLLTGSLPRTSRPTTSSTSRASWAPLPRSAVPARSMSRSLPTTTGTW